MLSSLHGKPNGIQKTLTYRPTRFVCIRILCRVLDVTLLFIFLKYYGESANTDLNSVQELLRRVAEMFTNKDDVGIRVLLAIGVFHYTFDFFAQRVWVFGNQHVWTRKVLYDYVLYLSVRWSLLFLILYLITVAHLDHTIPLVWAGAIVGTSSVFIKYGAYYLIFQKKLHQHFLEILGKKFQEKITKKSVQKNI